MKKRIIGIDVARSLAIIGMIIVNFKMVLGQRGDSLVKELVSVFDGKAAATFVVLAGVGLALMTNSSIAKSNVQKLRLAKKRIVKRALFLFIIGLSYLSIWPADILHFYGVYMIVTLLVLTKNDAFILWLSTILIFLFPFLMAFIEYEAGWNFETFDYIDFWTVNGFFRNLLYNGFHPVIPWTSFMLVGLWFGKQDLYDLKFIKKSFKVSSISFILIQVASLILQSAFKSIEFSEYLFGLSPMPPLPLYMLNGITISIAVISACIYLGRKFDGNYFINVFAKTGQLALTFYVAHVVLGMGLIEIFGSSPLGEYSIQFSVVYALIFSVCCIIFASIWLRFKSIGPLEWIIRKITN